jgi:4-amino-4-deoxy-L-arabinose transferase-like glycosyltransferase
MTKENIKEDKEITIELKPELIILIIFSIFVLILNFNITLNRPIAFADEGFHTRLAQLIAEEKNYFDYYPFERTKLIYSSYSRPPFWNLLEAGFYLIFGFSELLTKFLTPFIVFITSIAVYILTKRIFDEKVALIASIITITIPSFVTYSVLFQTDIPATLYSILSVLTFIIATKNNSKKYFVLSAVFASIAFLTKIPSIAAILFFGFMFIYELLTERKLLELIKKYALIAIVILSITSGYFLRNYFLYGTPMCYNLPLIKLFDIEKCSVNKYKTNYSFSSVAEQTGTEQNVYSMGITNYLDFAYGKIWFVIFASISGLFFILFKKDKIFNILLLYFIFFLILFPFVVTRAEDTARYTLAWTPVFAILSAIFFSKIYETSKFNKFISIFLLALTPLLILSFIFNIPIRYYFFLGIFLSIISTVIYEILKKFNKHKYIALTVFVIVIFFSYENLNLKLSIMDRVKQFSPLFFEACNWIKNNPDKVPLNASLYTIWAHRAIYNCQRNAVSPIMVPDIELSLDVNTTIKSAKENGVDYIFIQKFSIDPQNRNIAEMYNLNFINMLENNNQAFIKIYENGPNIQQCLQQGGCDGNIIYRINYTTIV